MDFNSGGNSTLIHSVSVSWMYGFTSGLFSVLSATLEILNRVKISVAFLAHLEVLQSSLKVEYLNLQNV